MSLPLRILFVEDSEDDVALLLRELRRGDYEPISKRVDSPDALRRALGDEEWDIVVSDYAMPRFNGLQALAIHRDTAAELPFIMISGTVGEEIAVESIKSGANDYVMKENLIRFVPAVNRAIRESAERRTHRRAVVSLRESQSMLSLIYNHTSDMLVLFSVLPDESFRIASANRTYLEFARQALGVSAAPGLVGKRLEETLDTIFRAPPEKIAHMRQKFDAAMRGKRPVSFETIFDLPNRRMHVELNLVPVTNQEGGKQHLLWACRDITPRKDAEERQRHLEAQLQQSKKLEALGQLAGGIAHDFNNLLTGILGYSDLIKSDSESNSKVRGHIDQILKAATRAKDLVKQILAFSRRESLDRKPILLEPIVKEVLSLMRGIAPAGIRIESFVMPDLPPVLGDSTQLHQVLVNLCTNAVQAMGENGKMSVSLEIVRVDAAFARNHPPLRGGEFIRLSVSDSGPGISSSAMEHLFEPFFTTKPPGSGTGLGLAVVHGIVKNHEGTVSVYSGAGEGTTFQVYFPICASPSGETKADAAGPDMPRGNGERILFVDDEAGIVHLATVLLEQLGYQPVAFKHVLEALEHFKKNPDDFAAVVTDLTMPKMTGAELASAIHGIRPRLPVLLTSGYSGAIDEEHAARSGFTEILSKPFAVRSLSEALHRAIRDSPS